MRDSGARMPAPDEFPSEPSGSLASEISDVIDEHAIGLGADEISSAIEEVAREVDHPHVDLELSRPELEEELRRYVASHSDELDRQTIIDVLTEIAGDLHAGSLRPTVECPEDAHGRTIRLTFDSAFALYRQIPRLLDIRGFFLETDHVPCQHADLDIIITADGVDEAIRLEGRVARTAPNGVALQIYEPPEAVQAQLRELPEKIRRHTIG